MIALPRPPLWLVLSSALVVAVGIALVLGRQLAASEAACEARIASLSAQALAAADRYESLALRIAREAGAESEAEQRAIAQETIRYVDRIRTVRVVVPAECHAPMPVGVRDALADAAAAANRPM